MKVKVLHLDPSQYAVKRAGDRVPLVRNPKNPVTPNHKQREYVRAVVSAKMDRMFAKPFVAALDGHIDAVHCIARSRGLLAPVFTGCADGMINFWDLPHRKIVHSIPKAHSGFVNGLVLSNDDRVLYSVGSDRLIRAWRFDPDRLLDRDGQDEDDEDDTEWLIKSIEGSSSFTSIDHSWKSAHVATTCGQTLDVWDMFRSNSPIQSYQWGEDALITCKYNPSQENMIVTTMRDNSIGLFDLRNSSGIQKVYLKNKSNAVAWNPREPFVFAVANDDGNVYQMDMRKLGGSDGFIHRMHTGHVLGVMDVDYSPLGTELCTGGYDKTVRIFRTNEQKSREVYYTKRMQKVLSVKFTGDGRFVLSGSEDTNLRIWKAQASEKLGVLDTREKRTIEYRKRLTERYDRVPEVSKILKHRNVPKWIKNEGKRKADHIESRKIKEHNRSATKRDASEKVHPLTRPIKKVEQ
jgi:WD repeat and SOF domain-containing protein 1